MRHTPIGQFWFREYIASYVIVFMFLVCFDQTEYKLQKKKKGILWCQMKRSLE